MVEGAFVCNRFYREQGDSFNEVSIVLIVSQTPTNQFSCPLLHIQAILQFY